MTDQRELNVKIRGLRSQLNALKAELAATTDVAKVGPLRAKLHECRTSLQAAVAQRAAMGGKPGAKDKAAD